MEKITQLLINLKSKILLIVIFLLSFLGHSQGVPELMYYKFDSAGTSVPNDASAPVGNNPAPVTGLTIGGAGQFGSGLQGNAGATATNRVDPGWTGTHTGSWTISFWMNVPSPATTRYMFGNSTGNGTFRCFIGGAASGIRLTGGVPSITLDMPAWASGTSVVHYVYDQSAGTVSGYINGVFQQSVTVGASYPLVGSNFLVGSQGTSIDGIMDEFRMYNRALSAAEVAITWNISLPGIPCTGTPTAGTASATSRNCNSQPFTLSLTGATMAGNMTYQWQSSPQGANTWTNLTNATSTSYTVTNQTVATDYRCVVTCTNSSSSSTSNTVTVAQLAALGNFSENFDTTPVGTASKAGANWPNCWSYIDTVGTGYGLVVASTPQSTPNTYRLYRTNVTAGVSQELVLVSPQTDNLGNGTKQLRFSVRSFGTTTYINKLEILSMSDPTTTTGATVLATVYNDNNNGQIWQEYIVHLPATTNDYFAFRLAYNGTTTASSVIIDDVHYENLIPCMFPTDINVNTATITQTAAAVSWTASIAAGVTGYEYEVRSSGLPGSGASGLAATGTTNSTTTSVNVTGLSPSTNYTVYVRSICGSSSGIWTTFSVNFNTLCGIVDNFFEGFENTATGTAANPTFPLCWTYLNTTGGTLAYGDVRTAAARTGNNGYYTYRPSATNGDILLISPETNNLGNGAKQVRFWARKSAVAPVPKFEIYRMDGTATTSTKTLVQAITLTNTWEEFVVPLPQTTDDYFAFSFDRVGTAPYVYLDDIYYEDIPAPTLTTTQSSNICFGGNTAMASVVVEDGSAPFTYLWSPSGGTAATATGLTAGVYTVTVTDALSRAVTATVTITEPDEILANGLITNVACHGANNGSITLSPTGGTLPYTYLWNTGDTGISLSNLVPGTYSVTITDGNSCVKTESFTITEPTVLTTSGTQVDVSTYKGSDGSATVSASGGTAPYTYLWSNGVTGSTASGLTAGTYTVTVTDANGCTSVLDFVITQPIPLMIQSVSQTNVSCNGGNDGTATVVVIGGNAPYTYQWSPTGGTGATATGLTAGTYSVLITEATGDAITETFTITEPQAILASISQKTDITCNFASNGTATVTVSGGTAPYTYFWSNGMTTATANNLNVGTYNVQVVDAKGCKATAMVSITQPAALVLTSNFTDISCYGQNDGSASVSVTGGVGPYTYSWSNGQVGTGISNLAKGTYVVTITDTNNCVVTKSFIITEPAFVHPPVAFNQDFCTGQNVTLANVVITGSNIKWYSSANGNTLLPASTVLTNGTTYYASQTVGTCESSTRVAVKITLNQGTPLTTTQLNVCSNTRVQNMTIDGFNHTQLRWYNTVNSTTVIPVIQMLVTGTYYVSSVTGTCESARQAIQVTVAAAVPAPTASSQVVCGNSTLNDLAVVKDPSATLRWYSSLQSLIPLANTTVVSNGTYYVQQLIGGCESIKVAVSVQVINVSVPTMTSIITCEGNTIADLHPTTGQYVWYLNSSTTTALPDTFVITPGSYYLAYQNTGCISNKVNVAVTVNARPASPTGQLNQFFGGSARVSDLQMNQPNVSWFATYDDAVKQLNQLATTYPLQDKATYYGILKGTNNCGSLVPTAVTVRLNLSNAELDLTQLKYYPNPVDSELNISYIEEIKKVEVFTITGQRVFGNDYQGNEVKVDLSRLSAGTYLVKIETAKASQFVKIVKR